MTNLNVHLKEGVDPLTWKAEPTLPKEHKCFPYGLLVVAGAVLIAHVGLFALLVTQASNKEITLTTAPAASVRVSMVAPPPPPPAEIIPIPPAPQVLTSEKAERTVAVEKPKPIVKPKPIPKPKPVPKVEPPPVVEAKPVEPVPAPPREAPVSEKMLDLPASGPKDVQTVGCRVPAPDYPRQARRQKIEGNVLVRLQVDTQGQVQSANIARSSGNQDLDEAARKAVMGASCTPYMESGRAIAVRAVQPVSFRLNQ
ncbi:energy transducer TonB [Pseudomonas cedrina subsp. fulgida]|nr:energy transducer TonB [Pseudomonas cedrina subsp. fulgida]